MSSWFSFTMPGAPPSWNKSYRITRQTGRGGTPYHTLSKSGTAERYQTQMALIARTYRPSDFQPRGPVIVSYKFFLGRDMDVDNCLKMMNDALEQALGINDKNFLVATPWKTIGDKDPRVMVGVYDAEHWQIEVRSK